MMTGSEGMVVFGLWLTEGWSTVVGAGGRSMRQLVYIAFKVQNMDRKWDWAHHLQAHPRGQPHLSAL